MRMTGTVLVPWLRILGNSVQEVRSAPVTLGAIIATNVTVVPEFTWVQFHYRPPVLADVPAFVIPVWDGSTLILDASHLGFSGISGPGLWVATSSSFAGYQPGTATANVALQLMIR